MLQLQGHCKNRQIMKKISSVIGVTAVVLFFVTLQAGFSSCKKEIVRDTLYIKDTIRIKDTVHVVDSSNCSCYNLSDGLVAYYNFNNGNLNDSSGYNNNIIFSNAVKTTDRFGRANNAYLFDGSNAYMKVANSASLNPSGAITLMATFKINGFYSANCVNNQLFGKGWYDFINGFYVLRFYSTVGCQNTVDTSKEQLYGNYGDLSGRTGGYDNSFVHSNIWYNVVYTVDGGVSKLYVNGVLKSTTSAVSTTFSANSQELFIGKHGDPQYPYYFNGVIDEIRIYNKALCAAAVTQLYNTKQ